MDVGVESPRLRKRFLRIAGPIALLLLAVSMFVASWSNSPVQAAQVATPTVPVVGTPEAVAPESTGPAEVTVGVYLTSIYGLDQQANRYYADFYLWMRWRGEANPTLTLEMLNNSERWGLAMIPISEEPKALPNGEFIQQFHVQGQFYQPLVLDDYPLDKHGLTIVLEDSTFVSGEQVYVADQEGSGISPDLRIPGWNVTGWEITTQPHQYNTGFGEAAADGQEYSTIRFTLDIERPQSFFVWKLLLPLVIVLLLGCSVLLVHPSYSEVRLAGPATALLTLIFLQQTYTSTLPENSSLVMLDKIYALAYALVIGLIAITIITSNWVRHDEKNTTRAAKLDLIASSVLFGFFIIGTAIFLAPMI